MALRFSRIQTLRDYSKMFFKLNFQHYPGSGSLLTSHVPSFSSIYEKSTAAEILGLPRPPKKPLPTFLRYLAQEGEKYPHLSYTELVSKLGEEWKTLDESRKAKFREEYDKDNELYKKKQSDYLSSLTPEQVEEIRELKAKLRHDKKVSLERRQFRKECERMGRPKHPGSPITTFIESYKADQKLPQSKTLTTMAKKWNELPESKKEQFKIESEKKLIKFKEDVSKWEAKMRLAGRYDLVKEEPAKTPVKEKTSKPTSGSQKK